MLLTSAILVASIPVKAVNKNSTVFGIVPLLYALRVQGSIENNAVGVTPLGYLIPKINSKKSLE